MKSKDETAVIPVQAQATDKSPFPEGTVVSGKLVSRTRKQTKNKEGKVVFLISLSILAAQGMFIVDRWSDEALPADLPVVGQQVRLPIRITPYVQAGVPKIRLVWTASDATETF